MCMAGYSSCSHEPVKETKSKRVKKKKEENNEDLISGEKNTD